MAAFQLKAMPAQHILCSCFNVCHFNEKKKKKAFHYFYLFLFILFETEREIFHLLVQALHGLRSQELQEPCDSHVNGRGPCAAPRHLGRKVDLKWKSPDSTRHSDTCTSIPSGDSATAQNTLPHSSF